MKTNILRITIAVIVLSLITGISVYAAEKNNVFSEPTTEEEALKRMEEDLKKEEELSKLITKTPIYPDGVMEVITPADDLKIEIKEFDGIRYKLNTLAYSEGGRVASMQRKQGSVWYELVVTRVDEVERYENVSTMATSIFEMDWLDEDQLQILCHVNPSTSELIVYNDGKFEKYYGSSFVRDNKGTLYFVDNNPHFSYSANAKATIVDQYGIICFESEKSESILQLNVTDKYFIMYVKNTNEESKLKLLVVSREDSSIIYENDNPKYGRITIK